jgi:hypothetical protein
MLECISFKYDRQILKPEVDVDFNDSRVKQHLAALVNGVGSTTECIVIDFVKCTCHWVCDYQNVQEAWDRLDGEQQDYVLAFRHLIRQPILGDRDDYPHLFFSQLILQKYLRLFEEYENNNGEDSATIDIEKKLVKQAERAIRGITRSENNAPVWSIEKR